MTDLAIDTAGLAKTYRGRPPVEALKPLDLQVAAGETFGLLGPNGAGKTTLVKLLLGLVRPTAGTATLFGRDIGTPGARRPVGYLPEGHRFPPFLTARQTLDVFGQMAGVEASDRPARADELLGLVRLGGAADRPVGAFSKGMLQRLGIAQALMNRPRLVFLDEPTDGVDPVGRREIRQILAHLKDEGRAVFLNSHLLSEIEMVCDRVAIMVQGKVLRQGTIGDLTEGKRGYAITGAEVFTEEHHSVIRAATDGLEVTIDATRVTIRTSDPGHIQPTIDALRRRGVVLAAVTPVRPTLEDLFMETVEADESHGRPGAAQNKRKGARP